MQRGARDEPPIASRGVLRNDEMSKRWSCAWQIRHVRKELSCHLSSSWAWNVGAKLVGCHAGMRWCCGSLLFTSQLASLTRRGRRDKPARSLGSSYTQGTFRELGSDNETRRASSNDGTAGKRIRSQLEVGLHLGRDETRCPESLKAWKPGREGTETLPKSRLAASTAWD